MKTLHKSKDLELLSARLIQNLDSIILRCEDLGKRSDDLFNEVLRSP